MISERFFLFSSLSVQGPTTTACSVICRAFLWVPPPLLVWFFLIKKTSNYTQNKSARLGTDMEHGSSLKKWNKIKLSSSSISHMSNSEWADATAPHVTIALTSIFFPPMHCQSCCHSHYRRGLKAIRAVVYLQALDKAYVPETAAGFEGIFPNCTGTVCCRKHNNHSLQALFSLGWFIKIKGSRHSIYQFEQKWTFLLLFRQCLRN